MIHPLVYELNTRCWLRELSDESGGHITLANVPDGQVERWQRFGFTHIWLMGVWTTGPRSCAVARSVDGLRREYAAHWPDHEMIDLAGSPYSIAEYRVSAELGGDAGLKEFRQKLHARGMKLILDFVPNHLGLDHRWLIERPDLLVQGPADAPGTFAQETQGGPRWLAHGKDPYFPPWTDTAQLDYRLRATHDAMRELLLEISGQCDGVRCDMAMLILKDVFAGTWKHFSPKGDVAAVEFWAEAIEAVRQRHPDFLFLAEAYWGLESRLQALGFDFTYDKTLYDDLIRRDPTAVQRHLLGAAESNQSSTHFLENHDEPRVASLLSPAEHRAAALVILALPGMRFLHEGQLTGARIKTPVQFARRPVEPPQPEIVEMYETLIGALRNSAVGTGTGVVLQPREAWAGNPSGQNFVIVQWQADPPEFDLAVVNLAPHRGQCRVSLTVPDVAGRDWLMKDRLSTEQYERAGLELCEQGIYFDLPAHGAQLFHFSAVH